MGDASCAETMPLSSRQQMRDVDLSVSAEDRDAAEELLRAIRRERGGVGYLARVIGVSDAAVRLWRPIPSIRVGAVLEAGPQVLAELRSGVPCIEDARFKVSPAERTAAQDMLTKVRGFADGPACLARRISVTVYTVQTWRQVPAARVPELLRIGSDVLTEAAGIAALRAGPVTLDEWARANRAFEAIRAQPGGRSALAARLRLTRSAVHLWDTVPESRVRDVLLHAARVLRLVEECSSNDRTEALRLLTEIRKCSGWRAALSRAMAMSPRSFDYWKGVPEGRVSAILEVGPELLAKLEADAAKARDRMRPVPRADREDATFSVTRDDRVRADSLLQSIRALRGVKLLARGLGMFRSSVSEWKSVPANRIAKVLELGPAILSELKDAEAARQKAREEAKLRRAEVGSAKATRRKVEKEKALAAYRARKAERAEAAQARASQAPQRNSAAPFSRVSSGSLAPLPAGGRIIRGIDPFATRECLVGPAAPRRAPNAAFDRLEAALARGPLVIPQPIPALSAARKPSREETRIAARLREGQVLRRCLCCDEPFAADGRFQRLCERHRRQS